MSGPSNRRDGGRDEEPDLFSVLGNLFGGSGSGAGPSTGGPGGINMNALLNLGHLPPRAQTHVRNVFLTLTGMTFLFTIGILIRLNVPFPLAVSSAISFASIMGLNFMQRTRENFVTRMGLLAATAVATGISTGDLVGVALNMNPMIVVQAATASLISFGSFALSALTSQRRSWLFLGGGMMSFLGVTLIFQLFARFFSRGLDMVSIWVGLIGLLGFILYDTQVMVERAATHKGWLDPVSDSMHMFTDLVGIFQRLIIILMEREARRKREEEAEKRRKRQ